MYRGKYSLIYKVKKGDIEAFERLAAKYYKMVYTLAFNEVGNEHGAKHLAYEVFINVYEKTGSIDNEYSFIQLLFKSIKEICINKDKILPD